MRRIGWDDYQSSEAGHYLGSLYTRQYVSVVTSSLPFGGCPSRRATPDLPGVPVTLSGLIIRDVQASAAGAAGISLRVPAGQSVALHGSSDGTAVDLLDVVAGLRRPRAGQVTVGALAVDRLGGAAMERYRGERGLVSARFPLLSSLSVTDNVLAALRSRRVDSAARQRVAELLVLTGAAHLTACPVETLPTEQRWRILIARALLAAPRLVLAEDPTPSLDPRGATRVLDLLMDAQARCGFTLLVATDRLPAAVRCQRLVTVSGGLVTADELAGGDDPWTRGRVDRIG